MNGNVAKCLLEILSSDKSYPRSKTSHVEKVQTLFVAKAKPINSAEFENIICNATYNMKSLRQDKDNIQSIKPIGNHFMMSG